jgi:hypothetical protein
MIHRLGVPSLIVLVVGVAFLGFASGDLVRHVWDKHPRHAGTQASPPHTMWKTTPGVAVPVASLAALPPAGAVVAVASPVPFGAPPRPPFVPPRG